MPRVRTGALFLIGSFVNNEKHSLSVTPQERFDDVLEQFHQGLSPVVYKGSTAWLKPRPFKFRFSTVSLEYFRSDNLRRETVVAPILCAKGAQRMAAPEGSLTLDLKNALVSDGVKAHPAGSGKRV